MEIDRIEIHGLDEMRSELMDHLMEIVLMIAVPFGTLYELRTLSRNYRMPPPIHSRLG